MYNVFIFEVAKSILETHVFIHPAAVCSMRNACGCAGMDKLFAILDFALIFRWLIAVKIPYCVTMSYLVLWLNTNTPIYVIHDYITDYTVFKLG